MNTTHSSYSTRLKVGMFSIIGLVFIAAITIIANGRPFWWKPCQLVKINVEDATGLKSKSPIRSLGIEIGYLQSVFLTETHVTLGICITAPVEVLPTTRAYIRGEGFLGDKFVELKPVRYLDSNPMTEKPGAPPLEKAPSPSRSSFRKFFEGWEPSAFAEEIQSPNRKLAQNSSQIRKGTKEIPVGQDTQDVQQLVNRVDELVHQMTGLTDNLKESINPEQLRNTMKQLNRTLENASRTLAPEGGLNQTAQRSLAKLEDAIEQLRDLMTRINKGEGSVGMLLNDPSYADEIRLAIKNINRLLNRVGEVKFKVDLGGSLITAYNGGRGWFQLGIWPKPDRYYLLGIAIDPRGRISNSTVTTQAGGLTTVTHTQVIDPTAILFTAMLGKVFFNQRLDLSGGALYGDGAGSLALNLGPRGDEEKLNLRGDIYFRSSVGSLDARLTTAFHPFNGELKSFYIRAGLESFRMYQGAFPILIGGGISFDDEDIKLLFALR